MPRQSTLLATTALTGVLLVGPAGTSAFAQLAPPPVYNWTGFYVGGHAGYGWGDVGISCTGCERTEFTSPKPAGALFGLQAGVNYQSGMWVVGIESDFSAMLAKDTSSFPSIDTSKATDQLTSRYDWLGTLRARGGIATGPVLFYGTGGLAAAGITHKYFIGLGDLNGAEQFIRHVRYGWTAGGGVEYAFQPNWSLKLEYLHVKLQDSNMDIVQGGFPAVIESHLRLKNEFDVVRAGLNFRIPPP
jgi:opacity protein-like surface antigen